HAATINVVGQVIDNFQAGADGITIYTVNEIEVDVVDRGRVAMPVDQVQGCAAYAFNSGQAQLHIPRRHVNGLRAQVKCSLVSLLRTTYPERHTAHRWTMLGGKIGGRALGFVVDDSVDLALPIKQHVL